MAGKYYLLCVDTSTLIPETRVMDHALMWIECPIVDDELYLELGAKGYGLDTLNDPALGIEGCDVRPEDIVAWDVVTGDADEALQKFGFTIVSSVWLAVHVDPSKVMRWFTALGYSKQEVLQDLAEMLVFPIEVMGEAIDWLFDTWQDMTRTIIVADKGKVSTFTVPMEPEE